SCFWRVGLLHFDSVLIPLDPLSFSTLQNRTGTETSCFYFRHDVWRTISEPSLTDLRFTMFESLSARDLQRGRHSRTLGHGQGAIVAKGDWDTAYHQYATKVDKYPERQDCLGAKHQFQAHPMLCDVEARKKCPPRKVGLWTLLDRRSPPATSGFSKHGIDKETKAVLCQDGCQILLR
ncbi:hypothetical protein HC762_01200, partial [bacterium]|nr:hypothetical protein [bacterium]